MSYELDPIAVHVTGPPPIEDVWLDLDPGVTAIYGLNGVGKSRMLRSVAGLLRGDPDAPGEILCTSDLDALGLDRSPSNLMFGLWFHSQEIGLVDDDADLPDNASDENALSVATVVAGMLAEDPENISTSGERWAEVVASQRLWLCKPIRWRTGDSLAIRVTPAWDAGRFPAAVSSELRILDRLFQGHGDDPPPSPAELETWAEHLLLRRSPFAVAVADGDQLAIDRETARLRQAHQRPYPLLASVYAFEMDHDEAYGARSTLGRPSAVGDVVGDDRPSPALVNRRTERHLYEVVTHREVTTSESGSIGGEPAVLEILKPVTSDVERDLLDPLPDAAVVASEVLTRISTEASATLERLFGRPASLVADVEMQSQKPARFAIEWRLSEPESPLLTIAELSEAQTRWACAAIELALATSSHRLQIRRLVGEREQWYLDEIEGLTRAKAEIDPVVTAQEQAEDAADSNREMRAAYGVPEDGGGEIEEYELPDEYVSPFPDADPEEEVSSDLYDDLGYDDVESNDRHEFASDDLPGYIPPGVIVSENPMDYEDYIDEGLVMDQELIESGIIELYEELAENRARVAVSPPLPLFLLIDEPEMGLHRSAERIVTQLLVQAARSAQANVIVATHSPEFLGEPRVRSLLLERSGPRRTAQLSSGRHAGQRTAEQLGLRDFGKLALYRGFVLVEGVHDQILLEELVADELWAMRAFVFPLHGGKLFGHVADSALLADFTDQPLVCILDKLRNDVLRQLLDHARSIEPGDAHAYEEGERALVESMSNKQSDEFGFARKLVRRSFELGRLDRFNILGLPRDDILHYLPAGEFVPGAESWADLDAAYAAAGVKGGLKPWLKQTRRADFSVERIRAACRNLDEVPEDFTQLLDALRASIEGVSTP